MCLAWRRIFAILIFWLARGLDWHRIFAMFIFRWAGGLSNMELLMLDRVR